MTLTSTPELTIDKAKTVRPGGKSRGQGHRRQTTKTGVDRPRGSTQHAHTTPALHASTPTLTFGGYRVFFLEPDLSRTTWGRRQQKGADRGNVYGGSCRLPLDGWCGVARSQQVSPSGLRLCSTPVSWSGSGYDSHVSGFGIKTLRRLLAYGRYVMSPTNGHNILNHSLLSPRPCYPYFVLCNRQRI